MGRLPKTNLAERIRDELADRIARGVLEPGRRLVELALAEEFGTSQAPVREALRMLGALRLVESAANRGTRVREISEREMFEAIVTRAYLEEGAARAAAPAFARDPALRAQMAGATAQQMAASVAGDVKAAAEHNAAFHRAIVAATGNATLLEVWDGLGLRARAATTIVRKNLDMVAATTEHLPIIAALARGDGDEAGRRLREHALAFAELHRERADEGDAGTPPAPPHTCGS